MSKTPAPTPAPTPEPPPVPSGNDKGGGGVDQQGDSQPSSGNGKGGK